MNLNLTILQLSDIHVSSGADSALGRAKLIRSAIQPRLPDSCAMLVMYTGDIAFSGQKQQYQFAERFFQEIANSLEEIPGLKVVGTVIIPGNHDCDFSMAGDARPVMLSSVAANLATVDLNGESVSQLLKVQDEFFEFEQKITKRPHDSVRDKISWKSAFAHGEKRILVRCLNTALFSRLKEMPGQLYFPLQAVPDPEDEADYAVTICHHPYGWMNPDNSRELQKQLELISDVILTGHEHDGNSYTRVSRVGEETNYVEGAALGSAAETGFNLVVVDLVANTNQIFHYSWSQDLYAPGSSGARVFTRKASLITSKFENNPEFWKQLNDVGAGFSHPEREMKIGDLFVYPELKVASIASKSNLSVPSWKLLSYVEGRELLQIAGPPTSGKSTLARVLYMDLQREYGLVPILLNGRVLKSSAINSFDRIVEKAFGDQYSARSLERFKQLEAQRRVLLIDDWHTSQLGNKSKRKILRMARAQFGRVILFADDVSLIQLLADIGEVDTQKKRNIAK